jgi:hypothetical protein
MQRIQLERLNGLVVSSGQGFLHLQALAGPDWPHVARCRCSYPARESMRWRGTLGQKMLWIVAARVLRLC